jgi:hypothetical protein
MAEIAEFADESACTSLLTTAIDGGVAVDQVIDVLSGEPNWGLAAPLSEFAAAGLVRQHGVERTCRKLHPLPRDAASYTI